MNQSNDHTESKRVRFVILHHAPIPGEDEQVGFKEHWDFMVEDGNGLATWQLFENPLEQPPSTIPAKRIGQHRKAYLEYEGPVSKGRGEVRKIEFGWCSVQSASTTDWSIELDGKVLGGQIELRCKGDTLWTWSTDTNSFD